MAIKLDMKKGYDRLDWKFIKKCFHDFGFADRWTSWIMERIMTTSFLYYWIEFQVNHFTPKRGIRQ